jgi:hypothetical protein
LPVIRLNYFNYYTEIEETFIRRRARNLFLSPLDWALMEGWQERGIPLHIVIRAVEQVFDNFDKNPGPRTIKGLMFCREEVEAQFDEWLKAQAGKTQDEHAAGQVHSSQDICEHLRGLAASLNLNRNPALREYIDRACARLEEISANIGVDAEQIDLSLKDVETLLDEALLSVGDRNIYKMVEKEVAGQLRPYKSTMNPEAYKATHRLMMLKRLREEENIPRLSLFYL